MLTIGDFARHGRVSVRMLRHYDAIGLLTPAHVDRATGYRSYHAGQLAALNRIVALKDLGFSLREVGALLADEVGPEEMRAMLTLRKAQLAARITADADRLARVEARLRTIETEAVERGHDVVVKALPAVRVAELHGVAPAFVPEAITPVIRPLYARLMRQLDEAGVPSAGPAIARYEHHDDGSVTVHAGIPVRTGAPGPLTITVLPEVDRAATIIHRGSMDGVLASVQALARWVEAHGLRSIGSREVYLAYPVDPDERVTELQELITQ
jgi:DNA-binding transcriptional MerR regulator